MRFNTNYMDQALFDLPGVIEQAIEDLSEVEFDTFVGTGFSGGVVVPSLALNMHKNFLLVRKPNDDCHHNGTVLGELGERWLFVDDFISSGATRRRVTSALADVRLQGGLSTTYVGDWLYRNAMFYGNGFVPAVEPEPEPEPEPAKVEVYEDKVTFIDEGQLSPDWIEEALTNWRGQMFIAATTTGRFVSRNLTPESFPNPL